MKLFKYLYWYKYTYLMENIIEIYKPIENFENYLISNLGNIKNKKTDRILKQQKSSRYSTIALTSNNIRSTFLIHRLVAKAFIPNLENKPTVNHKNHNTYDNNITNLEWATYTEQMLHNYNFENKKRETNRARSIIAKTHNEQINFRTISEGAKWLLENSNSKNIESCLAGIRNSLNKGYLCQGFFWNYNDLQESNIEGEIWKEIPHELTLDKPGYYVSNKGRFKNNRGKIVKLNNHNGYIQITIRNKSKIITNALHRIVAKIFVLNPEQKLYVNHIDGNKNNNCSDNLEWVTKSENTKHAHNNALITKNCRKINQYDKSGKFIFQYNSIKEASIKLGLDKSSIGHVCAKDRPGSNTCGGFIFKYADKDIST